MLLALWFACSAPLPAAETGGDAPTDSGRSAESTGPCRAYAAAEAVAQVSDPALDELSGLAVSRQNPGILWTHEDSGGAPELYALDATGATVATVQVVGADNVDWEDLAIGPCDAGWCLAVGDIGTLGTDRASFAILRLIEPVLDGSPTYAVEAEVLPYTWPDVAEDAESLALFPDGTPLVVSKRADATAGLYRLPAGATVLERLADVQTGAPGEDLTARATAADLSTDGAVLLLRTYLHLYEFDVTDPTTPGPAVERAFGLELQGEAVAYDPLQGGFWQVSEGVGPTLHYTGCTGDP